MKGLTSGAGVSSIGENMPLGDRKIATKQPPTPATKWPPRGIYFEFRQGRDSPFLARWREIGNDGTKSKRVTQSFADEKSRDAFVSSWIDRRSKLGRSAALSVPISKMETWQKFDELTGGANPIEVALCWLRQNGGHSGVSFTVAEVVKKYPSVRSKPIQRQAALHLRRFTGAFGGRAFTSITPEEIKGWAAGLRMERIAGREPSPKTVRHHLQTLRALWNAAIRQRWASFNAAAAVPLPHRDGEGDEVNILTVEEARRLFAANRDAVCVGRLALEAFGGLRFSSASRVARGDILLEDEGVVMPGKKHKSGRRHFVSGWPANLWKWIRHARPECWEIGERAYLDLKREAFVRAGLKPEVRSKKEEGGSNGAHAAGDAAGHAEGAHAAGVAAEAALLASRKNALRHSFASYHLAAFKDQGLTAYLMTKTSISSLNNDYRGRATQGEAGE